MRNLTQTPTPNNTLSVVYEPFNEAIRAIISDHKGKKTFAYGATREIAKENALHNFQRKYYTAFHVL